MSHQTVGGYGKRTEPWKNPYGTNENLVGSWGWLRGGEGKASA